MPRGSCLCGAVSFSWDSPSRWCSHCHCRLCQRAHGAAFVTWIGMQAADCTIDGTDTLRWYASSADSERGFCSNCGSTLFFRSQRWPGELHVALANIDGEADLVPAAHTYWESHAPWFPFSDDLPRKNGEE